MQLQPILVMPAYGLANTMLKLAEEGLGITGRV